MDNNLILGLAAFIVVAFLSFQFVMWMLGRARSRRPSMPYQGPTVERSGGFYVPPGRGERVDALIGLTNDELGIVNMALYMYYTTCRAESRNEKFSMEQREGSAELGNAVAALMRAKFKHEVGNDDAGPVAP